jgi:hypothetical protein
MRRYPTLGVAAGTTKGAGGAGPNRRPSALAAAVQAQPSSFSARPAFQIFVMWLIRPSLNCMT